MALLYGEWNKQDIYGDFGRFLDQFARFSQEFREIRNPEISREKKLSEVNSSVWRIIVV